MSREDGSHHYIVEEPRQPADPQPLLVMLHGYGSHEQDLVGLAPHLDGRYRVVSVRAPLPLPQGGFAWFPIEYSAVGLVVDYQEALAAARSVAALVVQLREEYGARSEATVLMGFSQGAGMAVAAALLEPGLVAGVASLSGLVVRDMVPSDAQVQAAASGLPVLMTHGLHDPLIPIRRARTSRDILSALPVELTWQEYEMGHEINGPCLEQLVTWLAARLD